MKFLNPGKRNPERESEVVVMGLCESAVSRVEEAECDCHLVEHGYKCSGRLDDYPLYRKRCVFERLWLWEKEGSLPVVALCMGNHWCQVVPFKVAVDPVAYMEWQSSHLSKRDFAWWDGV